MSERIRILCVDDEPNVLRAIKRIFLDYDYEIFAASSGEEGLRILQEKSPVQIVMSDYRMPGFNGVDFLSRVCEQWPDTVRIVLSGYADTAAVVDAINKGQIYKFLPKPWNDDEMRTAIANAIERYRLYAENLQLTAGLKKANEELRALNENLEALIDERTSELILQNAILRRSQEILDDLPIGVVGIDTEGFIVQMNKTAHNILTHGCESMLGRDRNDAFPKAMNDFANEVLQHGSGTMRYIISGSTMILQGTLLREGWDFKGLVITIDCEA